MNRDSFVLDKAYKCVLFRQGKARAETGNKWCTFGDKRIINTFTFKGKIARN